MSRAAWSFCHATEAAPNPGGASPPEDHPVAACFCFAAAFICFL